MNLRTFQADTMAAALQQVKRELGSSAVILHTRTFKRGGVLGLGARQVVEITASDDVNVATRPPRPRPRPDLLRQTYREATPTASPGPAIEPHETRGGQFNSTGRHSPVTANEPPTSTTAVATATAPGPAAPGGPPAGDPQLTEEIREIRSMVDRMMRKQSRDQPPDLPDKLFTEYLALLEQEVADELAEEIVKKVRDQLGGEKIHDEAAVRDAVARQVAELIPVDASPLGSGDRPTDGRPRTIALIGPTGVGKTTTLAKLAATLKLRHQKKVALVTIDTYRIAAVDQLKTYADIIKVPLHVVLSPDELGDALARCQDCDVVLIDTAGRSQRDDAKLEQLQRFLDVANAHEVHLVLSSTCSQRVLMEAVERFMRLRVDRIIFTKLDEAVNFGVLLNVVRRVDKQLSYVTTGQEVPHQIEPGSSARLAGLILGERM